MSIHLECAANYLRTGVVMLPLSGVTDCVVTEAAWRSGERTAALARFVEFLRESTATGGTS